MIRYVFALLGAVLAYEGWVYYSDPQRGYRLDNWPFALKGTDGVTEDGESSYRARGAFMMAMGALVVVVSVFGIVFG